MDGPEGYINTNPGVAIESGHCAVGQMDMGPGQRLPEPSKNSPDSAPYSIHKTPCSGLPA